MAKAGFFRSRTPFSRECGKYFISQLYRNKIHTHNILVGGQSRHFSFKHTCTCTSRFVNNAFIENAVSHVLHGRFEGLQTLHHSQFHASALRLCSPVTNKVSSCCLKYHNSSRHVMNTQPVSGLRTSCSACNGVNNQYSPGTNTQQSNEKHGDIGKEPTADVRRASKERKAAIKHMLDDAVTGTDGADEFDFDPDSQQNVSYPRGASQRQRHDPSETSVFLFPGQGSQFVGMGHGLLKYPNVEDMFSVASDILGYDLLGLCINGPIEELNRTIHCQPAVVVTSLAALEKVKEEQPKAIENCVAAAGFSVGEFAALVFAGSLSFEDAIFLIKVRAEAMQRASEVVSSGMLSVVGGRRARYNAICKEAENYCRNQGVVDPVCHVANYLFPDARVLAGNTEALTFIREMSKSFQLRVAKPLPVSGAFHTPLMAGAQEALSRALDSIAIETPLISVHSNVDGKRYMSGDHVRKQLKKQLVEPVRWEQTMHDIYQREGGVAFPFTYEMGPGNQLGVMLKRNNLKASHSHVNIEV